MNRISILGICGSLRKGSYNRMALNIAAKYMPQGALFSVVQIDDLPLFNQDLETNPPLSVLRFRKEIEAADAILFASNECNYSISAPLKNAIEWGSRPYAKAVLHNKPAAILGVTTGALGTARAQYHLRQICVQLKMFILNAPEVMIPFAMDKFGDNGSLKDEYTEMKIKELVEALIAWTLKLK